jgi:hypothetical protein
MQRSQNNRPITQVRQAGSRTGIEQVLTLRTFQYCRLKGTLASLPESPSLVEDGKLANPQTTCQPLAGAVTGREIRRHDSEGSHTPPSLFFMLRLQKRNLMANCIVRI